MSHHLVWVSAEAPSGFPDNGVGNFIEKVKYFKKFCFKTAHRLINRVKSKEKGSEFSELRSTEAHQPENKEIKTNILLHCLNDFRL